jgi:hypothetical protein
MPDDEMLALVADAERVLVTHDRRTMPEHFRRFVAARHATGAVIVSRRLPKVR